MSVLLRQAHGFEGFIPVGIELDPSDLPTTHGIDRGSPLLDVGGEILATTVISGKHEHPITEVDHVLDLRVIAVPRSQPVNPCGP